MSATSEVGPAKRETSAALPRLDTGVEAAQLEAAVRETWDFGNASASYAAMTAQADAAPPGSAERAIWQTQAARALGLQEKFDEANHLLDQINATVEAIDDEPARRHARARIAIERGRAINSAGDPAAARPCFEQALSEAQASGSLAGLEVDAMHMLAIAADSPEDSLRWDQQALALAESSSDAEARRWRGSLLNNLGWDHHDAGRFEDALECFERALDVRREGTDAEATHIAAWAVARALRSLGRADEALARQRALAATREGADDGYVHEEIGECLRELGRAEEAQAAFARARALLGADGQPAG